MTALTETVPINRLMCMMRGRPAPGLLNILWGNGKQRKGEQL